MMIDLHIPFFNVFRVTFFRLFWYQTGLRPFVGAAITHRTIAIKWNICTICRLMPWPIGAGITVRAK